MPSRPLPPGARYRPVIAKLLHLKYRDHVLAQAGLRGEIKLEDCRIMIFLDFTSVTQKQRALFTEATKKLRDLEIQYAMLFPANLRLNNNNTTLFFTTHLPTGMGMADSKYPCHGRGTKG
ncbi:hypothetical protein NDU88_002714 [Pleurodeles waltl]|uniref:Uncharacterized protein n=1 Tax=Pleurodeles waltl TaxID=8319 RepID=A0AAV7MNG0_PLEWA|nr:hypothetical protein NDU88_002714 [Pleurodeles waltl]